MDFTNIMSCIDLTTMRVAPAPCNDNGSVTIEEIDPVGE